jgi:phosphate transport system substrate-binding protein
MKINTGFLILVIIVCFIGIQTVIAAEQITICGTGDSQELLRVLGKEFEVGHPGVTVNVPDSIGSGGGIRAVARGKCELGRIARPLQENEKKYNLGYRLFAMSPVVFVLHRNMDLPQNLSTRQVIDIFSGRVVNWQEVDGLEGEIYLVNREEQDSSRTILEQKLPGFKDIKYSPGRVYYSTQEAGVAISSHRQTIGYLPLVTARENNLNILEVNGIFPTSANVQAGTYKLVAPFGIVWKGELTGLLATFIDFLASPAARELMETHGVFAVKK